MFLICCAMVSCHSTQKVIYMQDVVDGTIEEVDVNRGIVIQPKDILSIVISSQSPELVIALNLPMHSYQAGSTSESGSYTQRLLGYVVDMNGDIDFPIHGKINVVGKTREELSETIKEILIDKKLIMDPIVTIEFMNFRITVLGEVRNPGTILLANDRITLLEALGRAGDLTIYGKRDNVLVMREQSGEIKYYRVDLRSSSLNQSPAYYLQQNDVVYVEPNSTNAMRSEINENKSLGVLISLASLLMSLAVIIFK